MDRFIVKRLIVLLLILIGLLLVVGGAVYVYRYTDLLHIRTIRYNESEHMDLDSIELYSGVAIGTPFFEVNLRDAELGLQQHPYVLSARAESRFPNEILFDITYWEHIVCVRHLDILLSVDDNMVVLTTVSEDFPGYRVEGLPFHSFAAGQRLEVEGNYVLRNAINFVKLFRLAGLQAEDVIRCAKGEIRFRIDGITVNFGTGVNTEERFNAFHTIFQDLKRKGAASGVIDISGDGAPIFRPFEEG